MLREAYSIIIIKLYIFFGAFNKPNLHMYFRIYVKFKSEEIRLYHAYSPITIERVRELFQQPLYIILKYGSKSKSYLEANNKITAISILPAF